MNKYSKAVKTAATVGMSLAMVLSAVTPVSAAFGPTPGEVCDSGSINFVAKLMDKVEDLTYVNNETTFGDDDVNLFAYAIDAKNGFANAAKLADVANCYTTKDEYQDYAEKLIAIIDGYTSLVNGIEWTKLDKDIKDDKKATLENVYTQVTKEESTWVKTNVAKALAYQTYLNDFEYFDNLTDEEQEMFEETKTELDAQLEDLGYTSEVALDEFLAKLEKGLEDFLETKPASATLGVKANISVNANRKAAIEDKIKEIKSTTDYKLFKDNEAVEAIIEQYEEMLEEVANVAEVTNTRKSDAYKAFIKKTDGESVKTRLAGFENSKDEHTLGAIKAGLKLADFEVLKEFKEEVVDTVWTFDTKAYGDFYVNKSDASSYVTEATLKTVLADFDLELVGNFDREEGTFGWDELVAHMEDVQTNLDAVTTDIEKLDAVTLMQSDREAVLAAEDALYFFEDNGYANLTTAQEKAVKRAERKVNELLEAYRVKFGSINAGLNGWVNKGNGDYAYYENGNAVTKWVASGKDWYYVKDGKMLRNSWVAQDHTGKVWYYVGDNGAMVTNTTIDGCYINSYGAWTK